MAEKNGNQNIGNLNIFDISENHIPEFKQNGEIVKLFFFRWGTLGRPWGKMGWDSISEIYVFSDSYDVL